MRVVRVGNAEEPTAAPRQRLPDAEVVDAIAERALQTVGNQKVPKSPA